MTTENFYSKVRPLFGGRFSQSQMRGMIVILAECRRDRANRQAAAYILATAFHETGSKMAPVREGFADTDERAIEVVTKLTRRRKIRNYAKVDPVTGKSYFGRGLVQLTHKRNYDRAGKELGVDLVGNPGLALDMTTSARILVRGMRGGWFTGVSLDDVSEPETSAPDFTNDRKVVNGSDRAVQIAGYADVFHAALADVDLLSESRTIKAAANTRKAGGAAAIATIGSAVLGHAESLTDAINTGSMLSKALPWAGGVITVLVIGLFLYMRWQQGKIEDARRDDNEAKGT